MSETVRVALLVDGENLSSDHAGFLIVTAGKRGVLQIKRVFGAVSRMGAWTSAPGFRVVHSPAGKNAGDIALSLDALALALTKQVDEFVIATSDRDFALVALRLAELGFPVFGIGEEKAPAEFRKACRNFSAIPSKERVSEAPRSFDKQLQMFLRTEGALTDGWVSFSALGQARAREMGVSKAEAGIGKSASWIDWFKSRPQVYEVEGSGTQSRARLRSPRP